MRATLLLCDYAVVENGKLYVSGGGWSFTGPTPTAMALAVLIHVPWDRANSEIAFELTLSTEDGHPVVQRGPTGDEQPVSLGGTFEVGRPPGTTRGTELNAPLAINIGPMPLVPGSRYVWRLELDGRSDDDWVLPFQVRPAA